MEQISQIKYAKGIIPVINNGSLQFLKLIETTRSFEYLEELKKNYSEQFTIDYKVVQEDIQDISDFDCKKVWGYSFIKSRLEDKYHLKKSGDKITIPNEAKSIEIVERDQTKEEFKEIYDYDWEDDDDIIYRGSMSFNSEQSQKKSIKKDAKAILEIEIFKNSVIYDLMYYYFGLSKNIVLSTILDILTNINKKHEKFTNRELNLTQNDVMKLFEEYLSLIEIEDGSIYSPVSSLTLSITGEQLSSRKYRLNYNSRCKNDAKYTQDKIEIDNPKVQQELLELLFNNGYANSYKRTENGIMMLDYTDYDLRLAQENTQLLDDELKPLRKALIRK